MAGASQQVGVQCAGLALAVWLVQGREFLRAPAISVKVEAASVLTCAHQMPCVFFGDIHLILLVFGEWCYVPFAVLCEQHHVYQFSRSVMSDSATPWSASRPAFLSVTNSWSLMSILSVMPPDHLILCRPLLLLPLVFPSTFILGTYLPFQDFFLLPPPSFPQTAHVTFFISELCGLLNWNS